MARTEIDVAPTRFGAIVPVVLALLVGGLWYTSALWYYDGYSLPLS